MNHKSRRAVITLDGRLMTYEDTVSPGAIFPGDSVMCMVGRYGAMRCAQFDVKECQEAVEEDFSGPLIKAELQLHDNLGGVPERLGSVVVAEFSVLRPLNIVPLSGADVPIQNHYPWRNLLKAVRRNSNNLPSLGDVPPNILNLAKFDVYE